MTSSRIKIIVTVLFIAAIAISLFLRGMASGPGWESGMCTIKGVDLTETQVRERASGFSYHRLMIRQMNPRIAIMESPSKGPVPVEKIDPNSWQVSKSDAGWKLKRYFALDFWHIVECNLDGSDARHYFEIGPSLNMGNIN